MPPKKNRKKDDDDDWENDMEALKAEMENPNKPAPAPAAPVPSPKKPGVDDDDDEGGLKSASQKRDEKKERERLKRAEEKAKEKREAELFEQKVREEEERKKNKKKKKKEGAQPDNAGETPQPTSSDVAAEPAGDTPLTAEPSEGKDDAKPSASGAKEGGEKKKKEKKENKGLKALKEQLEAQKREEARILAEIEEKKRKFEQEERERQEKEQREEERKKREKEKKKAKIQEAKKAGTFMTKAEKERHAAQQRFLEALKAQGKLDEISTLPAAAPPKHEKKKIKSSSDDQAVPSEDASPSQDKKEELSHEKAESEDEEESEEEEEEESEEEESEEEDDLQVVVEQKEVGSWEDIGESADVPDLIISKKPKEEKKVKKEKKPEEKKEKKSEEKKGSSSDAPSKTPTSATSSTAEPTKKIELEELEYDEDSHVSRTVSKAGMRSPVLCVMGHVDTGKTKLLDKIRRSNVQDGEAGGITQQIGATFFPAIEIKKQVDKVKKSDDFEFLIPGLLIIDTPGHESFSNLRTRGSSLANMAILVIDIMHGLEQQTIESIDILRKGRIPFVVALNKVDRLNTWQSTPWSAFQSSFEKQSALAIDDFETRWTLIKTQLAEKGLNSELYFKNSNYREYVSVIPTSAHTGEGIPDLLYWLTFLTQRLLVADLTYKDELQCSVLEVKVIPGLGTTIDVILSQGTLKESQTMVLCGLEGPIVTRIRALLMPQPMKEMRVKNPYKTFREISAAQGVKIAAHDLEKAVAGLPVRIAATEADIEPLKAEVAQYLSQALNSIKIVEKGVHVQASTLGSLEALYEFLKQMKIPVSGVSIGPVHKKDITRTSVQLQKDPKYAVLLAFDVVVDKEAQAMADDLGIRIFTADIIYHLFDKFTKYVEDLKAEQKEKFRLQAVFPCRLRILPQYIFNARDPIVMGVVVEEGILRSGTPIAVPSKANIDLGVVSSIEFNHESVQLARKGQEVCIKIEAVAEKRMFGRHFDDKDELVSKITRESIDICKEYFRDDLSVDDWKLMISLKKTFGVL